MLSHVLLFVTPWTIQFMEFSRQEYCSRLPFPPPRKRMTLCDSIDYTVQGVLQAGILEWVALSFLQQIFPTQELNWDVPSLQADSLPTELSGKPKNTGVGSLSLHQGIFPTQESNRGLLSCRQFQEIKLSAFELVSFLWGWCCF